MLHVSVLDFPLPVTICTAWYATYSPPGYPDPVNGLTSSTRLRVRVEDTIHIYLLISYFILHYHSSNSDTSHLNSSEIQEISGKDRQLLSSAYDPLFTFNYLMPSTEAGHGDQTVWPKRPSQRQSYFNVSSGGGSGEGGSGSGRKESRTALRESLSVKK